MSAAPVFDPAAAGWSLRPPAGFSGHTGPLWMRAEGDGWAYGVLTDAHHANGHGMIHGGMIMTLLDNSLGMTVWRAVAPRRCVTMQLNTHFLSAALPGEFLEARGEVVRLANSVVFVRGTVTVGERMVATADGIWKILSAKAGTPQSDPA